MRHVLCGGTKVISHLDEKRKRFPVSLTFRRQPKSDNGSSAAPVAPKSPVSGIQLVLAEPIVVPQPVAPPVPIAAPLPVEEPVEEPGDEYPAAPAADMMPRAAVAALHAVAPAVPAAELAPADPGPAHAQPAENDNADGDVDAARLLYDEDVMTSCTLALLTLFPNICPDYLQETSQSLAYDYESIVSHILDQVEEGTMYPQKSVRKRKRKPSDSADDAAPETPSSCTNFIDRDNEMDAKEKADRAIQLFGGEDRPVKVKTVEYITFARTLMQQAYPFVPHKHIATRLLAHNSCLLPAVLDLDSHIVDKGALELSFFFKKARTKLIPAYAFDQLPRAIRNEHSPTKKEALEEYFAALKIRQLRKVQREAEKQREIEEEANFKKAQQNGTAKECECCFGDFAMNRMVHCNASMLHWFCRDCARRMAENQIGLSKYTLECMSMDGCKAGFSYDQRGQFLDQKTTVALERIEQEHVLRIAGIENLETCPFCPFAAEYPSVEVNKEFVCHNPECEAVSCRLCRKETHIPKTCAEVERENSPSVRLTIEEAMSKAMIRNCNKCGTPFIKDYGCNKMTCARAGCNNVQCYVCHKSCEYSHFDDTTHGGKKGNCPLFESAEERHEGEVQAAEEKARQDVVKSNPDVDVNLLKIHLSDKVVDDEKRRKTAEADRQAANRR